jgi:outer membrane protein OmpA-like peptidoglycan-associated protein
MERFSLIWCFVGLLTIARLLPVAALAADKCDKARDYYVLGTSLSSYEERRKAFQAAVDLCPSLAMAHVNLADSFENLALMSKGFTQQNLARNNQFLDKAISEYQAALKCNDKLFEAYLGLAENYARIGLYHNAQEAYKNALAVDRHHALTQRTLAGLDAVERAMAGDKDGFKSSQEILGKFRAASKDPAAQKLMGFEDVAVVRDRQRFVNIVFDEWSSQLTRKEAVEQLEEMGKALSSADLAQCQFIVEGHTDPRGGQERNQKLSGDRAESVKKYLVDRFTIDPSKVTTQGLGYDRPRFPNDTPAHMLKNRRVELLIVERTDRQ